MVGVGAGSIHAEDAEVKLGRAQLVGICGSMGGLGNEVKCVKAATVNEGDGWIDMVWLQEYEGESTTLP